MPLLTTRLLWFSQIRIPELARARGRPLDQVYSPRSNVATHRGKHEHTLLAFLVLPISLVRS